MTNTQIIDIAISSVFFLLNILAWGLYYKTKSELESIKNNKDK